MGGAVRSLLCRSTECTSAQLGIARRLPSIQPWRMFNWPAGSCVWCHVTRLPSMVRRACACRTVRPQ
eukprot:11445426-Alexandrium_andersonii.AAC.1